MDLAKKYGPSRPFNDEELIKEIVGMVHPDLQSFFDRHISGSENADLKPYFTKIGWDFENEKQIGH